MGADYDWSALFVLGWSEGLQEAYYPPSTTGLRCNVDRSGPSCIECISALVRRHTDSQLHHVFAQFTAVIQPIGAA